jgi:hypothetical protein
MTAGTSTSNPTETPGGDTDEDSDDTDEQPAETPDISLTPPEAPPQQPANNPALPEPEVPGIAVDTSPEGTGGVGGGGGPGSAGGGGLGALSNGNDNGEGDSGATGGDGAGVSPEVDVDTLPPKRDWPAILGVPRRAGQTVLDRLVKQDDPSLAGIPNMALYGCRFRAFQAAAEFWAGRALTPEQIKDSVKEMQKQGAVTKGMTVLEPDKVLRDTLDRLGRPDLNGRNSPPGNAPALTVLESHWTDSKGNTHEHNRLGDAEGNPMWDPYGGSLTDFDRAGPPGEIPVYF